MGTPKRQASIQKELNLVARQEQALRKAAMRQKTPQWKTNLQDKVPEKVYSNLEKAFCKAFEVIFDKGTDWIEKHMTHNLSEMVMRCMILHFKYRQTARF